ncbi:M6 family metalloprotease-like protein/LPXTG-motif cell wall-anchored protein [Pullulanibacillus pueri]|uniref:M6 family metalloprotease domain-containing protein n=1 Tax=Pullulanibacillus pueri TaxID=1437324 RepID=A0A8J3EJ50_9BACL|nr:immune inhibitor A domain-containing protein [Pullulanibacillus pueri]MBM7680041.1 M6 family metalloprotease-like protein/LPXTG-motif cell wall-anchored protein [Pullulanibacillus pueri]GGH74071.1 hypothetical protein GCM10007096_01930 [Pullulanibacillus pueri]
MVDWKKVIGTSVLSAGLIFSAFAPLASAESPTGAEAKVSTAGKGSNLLPAIEEHTGSPFDLGLVNEEKVKKLLIREGIVDKNASNQKQDQQMRNYLNERQKKTLGNAKKQKTLKKTIDPMKKSTKFAKDTQNKVVKSTQKKAETVDPIKQENWNGQTRKDKVLVLLMEFPDNAHNKITDKDDPILKYDDFNKQHYQNMIFGKNGYTGPDGQDFISVKKFYDQQSGNSYTIDGNVAGWYMADHPAAYYGGNDPATGSDGNPRELIYEALTKAAADKSISLSDYDQEDPDDWDGDDNTREPDGIIDHLMVIHSGVGEEAGGGRLGADAIWSHSWDLGGYVPIPGTHSDTTKERFPGQGVDQLLGYKYTVEPEDGAAGVFAHEYGHNLGLPDDYDTNYTHDSVGAPTAYWTIMASGSWGGKIPGTEPTGFGAKDKEFLQSTMPKSNWFHDTEYDLEALQKGTQVIDLDEASVKGTNADGIRINLPDKQTKINQPTSGTYEYFSGSQNNVDNRMTTSETIDLSSANSAELQFKTWYSIEQDFDYAYVGVSEDNGKNWTNIAGNITTTADPNVANLGNGITGESNGWKDATFDLSAYSGKKIMLRFEYVGDPYVAQAGFYVDDIAIKADGKAIFNDDAESSDPPFVFEGFSQDKGIKYTEQYYLVEWRNYAGADTALEHLNFGDQLMNYDPGMVVWYVDNNFDDNWVGDHPGDGFLGVVDAHQKAMQWKDTNIHDGVDNYGPASTQYQVADAAFSLNKTAKKVLDLREDYGRILKFAPQTAVATFDDSRDYSDPGQIYAGRNIPSYGLKIHVLGQADDLSVGRLALHVGDVDALTVEPLKTTVYSSQQGHNQIDLMGSVHDDGHGESVSLTYALVNADGKTVLSETENMVGLYQTFEHVLTIPKDLKSDKYTIKVTSTDAKDHTTSSKPLTITVDNTAPVITLKGDNPLEWEKGKAFKDPGFKASDNVDGNLQKDVKVSGQVDVEKTGEYTLTYSVTDKVGNTSSVKRNVEVLAKAVGDTGNTGGNGDDNGDTNGTGHSGNNGHSNNDQSGNVSNDHHSGTISTSDSAGAGNLPNTATHMFNWLLIGALMVAVGLTALILQRRKKRII